VLCTVAVTYQSIFISQNIVIINTNWNTTDLLLKPLFSVYCIVDHFCLLIFLFPVAVVLSIYLQQKLEDTKGVVKNRKWKNRDYDDQKDKK
jgi:hypothetical protein